MKAANSMSSSTRALNVVLVDDHVLVAQGIQRLVSAHVASVVYFPSGEMLLAQLPFTQPDLILLDITMPGLNGLEVLGELARIRSTVPVVMLTMHDEPAVARRALDAGAKGYVLKHSSGEDLLAAIESAARGQVFVSKELLAAVYGRSTALSFTPSVAQMAVLRMVESGMTAKQIAEKLGVSRRTVESHKYALMQEFGVRCSIQMVSSARRAGLV